MRVSVILAHPRQKSFNAAIAREAVDQLNSDGHEVFFHDLYAEKFDPMLPFAEFFKEADLPEQLALHCKEIAEADGIVIVHPNWWGQPPAILKGWVDRVIRPGLAYQFLEGDKGEGIPEGLLKARAALVFTTSNTPMDREMEVFGDPLETIWKNCIFAFCGVHDFHRENFCVMVTSTPDQRREWLDKVRETVKRLFPG